MNPTLRTLLASVLIAAVVPLGAAVLDLEQPAFAKNGNGGGHGGGNGNGGGHGNSGGNGGGNSGGNGHGHGNSGTHASNAKAATAEVDDSDTDTDEGEDADDGLSPGSLGKLNGVLHASPNAIAHASVNSPIGTARAFGEALAGFLGDAEEEEGDEATAEEGEGEEDAVTIDQLGEMMARMTNKPVTPEQVQAVAAKLGIESEEETEEGDEATGDEATGDEPAGDETGEEAPKLDQATAEAIANKANEIHGFATTEDDEDAVADGDTDDTADEDATDDDTDETADSGAETEEVPAN